MLLDALPDILIVAVVAHVGVLHLLEHGSIHSVARAQAALPVTGGTQRTD
jgi:hypothetical protein